MVVLSAPEIGQQPVLSRHRLPGVYRYGIVGLWLTPILLLTTTIVLGKGITSALLDFRLLIPFLMMALPAFYVWQEGVDVLSEGIRTRIHIPRYHTYTTLDTFHYDARKDRHVLMVWDKNSHKVLECRAGHLTHFSELLDSLKSHVPERSS